MSDTDNFEPKFPEDHGLSCQFCGGSGHIDDVNTEAIEKAYGALWRYTGTDVSIHDARSHLLTLIGSDGQKRGIEHAIQRYGEVVLPIAEMD